MTQQPTIRQILEAPTASRDRYTGEAATADELLARQPTSPLSTADLAASSARPAESWGAAEGSPAYTAPNESATSPGATAPATDWQSNPFPQRPTDGAASDGWPQQASAESPSQAPGSAASPGSAPKAADEMPAPGPTNGAPAPSPQPDVETSAAASAGLAAPGAQAASQPAALFERQDAERFRGRWTDVQAAFVDDPRQAVQQADGLVADLMQMLATRFADEKAHLEADWSRGDEISTEDLRLAFQHYRAFFDRLLSL